MHLHRKIRRRWVVGSSNLGFLPTYLPTSNTNTTAVVEQVVDLYVYQEKLFRSLDRR